MISNRLSHYLDSGQGLSTIAVGVGCRAESKVTVIYRNKVNKRKLEVIIWFKPTLSSNAACAPV